MISRSSMFDASSCVARLLGRAGLCIALGATSALAQGIQPGDLSKEGYKLPGGFEPVLHVRTFYLDGESLTGSPSEAWALGGWAGLRSPWWGDVFQLGLVGYTSQKLYGPEDRDGTKLLAPGQESIAVIGEAFGAVRFAGQTVVAYRQLIDRPFINPQDNRMVPNTFEAYTLRGKVDELAYTGGYITKIKKRDSESFAWMSKAAGGDGPSEGVIYAGGTWAFAKKGYVRLDGQYGTDVFRTVYADGKFPIAIDDKTTLALGAQYFAQRSVGDAQIGAFSTWGAGAYADIGRGPFAVQLYYTQTGRGYDTQSPFGTHASFLSLQLVDFNTAGEKAWGISTDFDFAGLGAKGLTASATYAAGSDRINPANNTAIANRSETDLRADYAFGKESPLKGLVATLRYGWLRQDGSPQAQTQLRVILNYPFSF